MAVAFRSAGTAASGTGAVTPGLPAGHAADDILILVQQAGVGDIPAIPAGWAQVGSTVTGTSEVMQVIWKRDNGAESAPSCTDAGTHQIVQMYAFSGCVTSGTPFTNTFSWSNAASTAARTRALNTAYTQDGGMVIFAAAHGNDSATGNQLSSWLNPGSVFDAALTEATGSDVSTSSGTGGGFALAYATMTTHGTISASTQFATLATSLDIACSSFVLIAAGAAIIIPAEFTQAPIQPARYWH